MPVAIYYLPKLDRRTWLKIIHYILIVSTTTASFVMYKYVIDFEANLELLRVGKSVYTPGNHIRYSIVLGFTVLMGMYSYITYAKNMSRLTKWLHAFATVVLLATIHAISIRTGLIVMYAGMVTLMSYLIIKKKLYLLGTMALVVMGCVPFAMYKYSPTFHQKINYMIHDWKQHKAGKGHNYADSGRIVSFEAGMNLWKQNPILGVGTGNAVIETEQVFEKQYPKYGATLMPHNQYVWTAMSTGITGLLMLLLALIAPLIKCRNKNLGLAGSFVAASLIWLILDHPFESTVGVGIYLLFWYLSYSESEFCE